MSTLKTYTPLKICKSLQFYPIEYYIYLKIFLINCHIEVDIYLGQIKIVTKYLEGDRGSTHLIRL